MLSNPVYDPYQILTKIYSAGAHVKQAIADTYIEEINRARTVKIVYGVLEKDRYLEYCIHAYAEKSPKLAVRTILKIALYMLLYMDKKRYMVTDCAVSLCKKLGKAGASGFINAFLRRFDKAQVEEKLKAEKDGESILVSYPEFAYRMLKKEYGKRAESIAAAQSAGLCVRFEKGEERYLEKPHIKTPFDKAYVFPNFIRDEGFDRGDYTFQSVGSIAICSVIKEGETLLDACAAPGGKSVLLSKKFSSVTAFELHPHRVELIRAYASRMGAKNVVAEQRDSSVYCENYREKFSAVLCDVPCSGFGTVSENPDIKLFKKESDFAALQKAQKGILETCSKYVKKGGNLYYSTCSIFERENDLVVEEFLKNHPEYEPCEVDCPLVHEKKKYGLQFLPDQAFGAGFFVAALRRKEDV